MSDDMEQQPICIKGGSKSGIQPTPIEIYANSVFLVTESYQQQQSDWVQSDSDYTFNYVDSIMVGETGADPQFAQTSSMAHPLTYSFNDSTNKNIFTIQEVIDGSSCYLKVSVDVENQYFQITQESKSGADAWTISSYNTTAPEVYSVVVTDANSLAVCRFVRLNEEDIYLNLKMSA